jgi:hypothetical protein
MAQAISSLGGNLQTTALKAMIKDVMHAAGSQRTVGGAQAEEKFAPRARPTPLFQIALQRVPNFIG